MEDIAIYILPVLILMSGFFSGAEIALFSLSGAKMRSLLDSEEKNITLLKKVKSDPQKLLITILIANNFINIGASSLATVVAIDKFGNAGAGIATGVMTFLILFFGEIIPKTIGQKYTERMSLTIAPFMWVIILILLPFVWVMNMLTQVFQKLFRIDAELGGVSEEEVKAMVDMGHEEGTVEHDEKEMIQNVFLLNDITAEDVMTPEEYFVSFNTNVTIREVLPVIQESGYSRFPILNTGGEVEGVLYIKDVFALLAKQAGPEAQSDIYEMEIEELMKPALFVPETTIVDGLLKDMQSKRQHIAIVVDEHGAVRGLVTLEDLLEEIVGEIIDETDIDEKHIQRISKSTIMIDPRIAVGKVNTFFNSVLSAPPQKTIGWLVLKEFGRIPDKGDEVDVEGYKFIVEEADDRRMKRLQMVKTAAVKAKEKKMFEG